MSQSILEPLQNVRFPPMPWGEKLMTWSMYGLADLEACSPPGWVEIRALTRRFERVQVFRGRRNGVQPVAVKHLRDNGGDDVMQRALRREIRTLRLVSADANVVQFYGAVLDGAVPAMVLEYCEVRRPPGHPSAQS